jgi:hypothetical protein
MLATMLPAPLQQLELGQDHPKKKSPKMYKSVKYSKILKNTLNWTEFGLDCSNSG